jgi:hypothetical protein
VVLTMLQPIYGSIAGEPTWLELLESDFFSWFNLSESGRSTVEGGLARVQLTPGGSQQFIDLSFLIDSEETVVGASLALDRSWLDRDRVALANGGDLTKSLLSWLGATDRALSEVARQLEATVTDAARVIVRGPREAVTVTDPQIRPLLDAFLGPWPASGSEEVIFPGQRLLRATNIERPDCYWFQLDWGDCTQRPGEDKRWSCAVCCIALFEQQVGEDPISATPRHWVWVPRGQVGHPVTSLV